MRCLTKAYSCLTTGQQDFPKRDCEGPNKRAAAVNVRGKQAVGFQAARLRYSVKATQRRFERSWRSLGQLFLSQGARRQNSSFPRSNRWEKKGIMFGSVYSRSNMPTSTVT
ncbi:hypothetical protein AWB74_05824 [Caballeronia arvi]|uniref:Uncharacterized protein n=1 Tax=Caballeronia arvi TaxID=1777135 RepID=A0A158KIF8_9BURK|nr:hypothetical protein AWB74_05824 [Caballeronia arvi]